MDAEVPLAGIRCGECGYCVHGLPLRGRCPECGTGYFADLYWPRAANFNLLLLPAFTIAISWAVSVGSIWRSLPLARWSFCLVFALAIVWAKRTAVRVAEAAYRSRLAATPIDQPPVSRAWYVRSRLTLFFLTQVALAKAGLFLASTLTKYCS